MVFGALHLTLGLADLIHYRPVSEQAVEEIVGKTKEAVHIDLHVGVDRHVGKLGFEAAELRLEPLNSSLRLVKMAVLCHVSQQTTTQQIPGSPAFSAIQAAQNTPDKVTLQLLDRELINRFLNWLEETRNCKPATRNQRLAAIHSFFRFLIIECPEKIEQCQQILVKKHFTANSNIILFLHI